MDASGRERILLVALRQRRRAGTRGSARRRDGVFYCLADPDPTSASVGEFLGPITLELFNERDALLREVAQLREALKRMTEAFYPHPRAYTEGWREEQEAYDGALIALGVEIPK
jgi:hypothetical protein